MLIKCNSVPFCLIMEFRDLSWAWIHLDELILKVLCLCKHIPRISCSSTQISEWRMYEAKLIHIFIQANTQVIYLSK